MPHSLPVYPSLLPLPKAPLRCPFPGEAFQALCRIHSSLLSPSTSYTPHHIVLGPQRWGLCVQSPTGNFSSFMSTAVKFYFCFCSFSSYNQLVTGLRATEDRKNQYLQKTVEPQHREKTGWINDQLPNNNGLYLGAQTEPGISQPRSFLEPFLFAILQKEKEKKCLNRQ